jgi:hypothetical protein
MGWDQGRRPVPCGREEDCRDESVTRKGRPQVVVSVGIDAHRGDPASWGWTRRGVVRQEHGTTPGAQELVELSSAHRADRPLPRRRLLSPRPGRALERVRQLRRGDLRHTRMTDFNSTSEEVAAIARYLRDHDPYTMIIAGSMHTTPPLSINERGVGLRPQRARRRLGNSRSRSAQLG